MKPRALFLIVSLALLPALAGCGSEPADSAPPPASAQSLAAISGNLAGVDREALGRAIDGVFNPGTKGETRALLIMQGGSVVAERYAPGYDRDTRFLGWSMSKCVTAIMIGMLASDGRLRLDETAPVPAWRRTGDPRGEITLRQLLQMRSGLRHNEKGDPIEDADITHMLFLEGRNDMAAYAEEQPLESEPGKVFEYSTATTMILSDLAADALAPEASAARRRKAVDDFLRSRLFDPAGMTSMTAEYDAAGTMIGSSMIHATARDWGKLGEFLRNKGSVRGAQLIPRRWIEFMRAPSPANPGYGAQVWLNRPQASGKRILWPDEGPQDLFACLGHMGQHVISSPSQKLTVVMLGHTSDEDMPPLRNRLRELIALFPAGG